MNACDGDHGVEIILSYSGQVEVRLENIPPLQCRRYNEIRECDLLIGRNALNQTAFEGNIEDSSRVETLDRVIEVLDLRRTRRIIIGIGMDEVVVFSKSLLIRRRHSSTQLPIHGQGVFDGLCFCNRLCIRARPGATTQKVSCQSRGMEQVVRHKNVRMSKRANQIPWSCTVLYPTFVTSFLNDRC